MALASYLYPWRRDVSLRQIEKCVLVVSVLLMYVKVSSSLHFAPSLNFSATVAVENGRSAVS
jgi:hypothetical protein